MKNASFQVKSSRRVEILIITSRVNEALQRMELTDGLVCVFTPHTTAAISVNENADPDVPEDLCRAFEALVPDVDFRHGEGNSDSHFLSTLIGPSVMLPFHQGKLSLGVWQGIYFIELDGPRTREVRVSAVS